MHDFTIATASKFTETSKALSIQTVGAVTGSDTVNSDTVYSDCFAGSWCLVAPPVSPEVDAAGNLGAGCECLTVEMGDDKIVLGQRDVRWAQFAQDAQPGEVILFNRWGGRVYLSQGSVRIEAPEVRLGAGASDPVVRKSDLDATVAAIKTWLAAHVHLYSGTPTDASVLPVTTITTSASSVVKAA